MAKKKRERVDNDAVIPCQQNADLKKQIKEFAEVLKIEAHRLGGHGLSEEEFYQGGLFRGAIERIRGQYSATMHEKKGFVTHVLNYMQDQGFVKDWLSAGGRNRYDYSVTLPNDRVSVIELKGCLDGNNTTISERPFHADEFIVWSICTNKGGSPRRNVWSGIHTRLSAEIIDKEKVVDGLVVWDWLCGTIERPCPKLDPNAGRLTVIGPYQLTPPCIYLFPRSIPSVRNNPSPEPHALESVGFLAALHKCFGGDEREINRVRFSVSYKGTELVRTTTVERDGAIQRESGESPIQRK